MRPDVVTEQQTRLRAAAVSAAVVLFHLLLLALMGLLLALILFSAHSLIEGGRFNPKGVWRSAIFLWVTWQALTIRPPLTDPSRLADLAEYPGLADALKDAAMRVGAEVPKAVRITTAARIYAREEGGYLGGLIGPRALLIVGVAALPYLTETELRVLLARALARWSAGETWYGVQAARVDLASEVMLHYLGSTWARFINPFYWLFYGFRAAFGRLLGAYRRQRELWADQAAAQAYPAADAELAIKKQALYDAFWFQAMQPQFTGKGRVTFEDCWEAMAHEAAGYGRWQELWEERLRARYGEEQTEPSLGERLQHLAASEAMPAPGRPAMTPATAVVLRE